MRVLALLVPLLALQFSSGVNLVEVYATVVDGKGRPVRGLVQNDFVVLEDGEPQTISAFVAGEFLLSVAVALDRSWSMAGESLQMARSAAHVFLGTLRSEDSVMIVAVGNEAEVLAPLSADRNAQHRALDSIDPWGTTSLHDAIIATIDRIQPAAGRRALILLSDGVDRYSRATAAEVLAHARGADVLVYPIALGKNRAELFAELAVLTGGRSFHLRQPRELESTFRTIAEELRHQYLLGYTPTQPIGTSGAPPWRSILVKVNRPDVTVRARDGYLAR